MSERYSVPFRMFIGSRETQARTLSLPASALPSGGVVSAPVVTLYRVNNGVEELYAAGLSGSPVLAGPPYTITQTFTALTAGATYRVYWRFNVGAQVDERVSEIHCDA